MAGFHSLAIMPSSVDKGEFYRLGTKIELLMNRSDPRYQELNQCMYDFLTAHSREEKWSCNAPFVAICQDVLKTEWDVLKRELATPQTYLSLRTKHDSNKLTLRHRSKKKPPSQK
jgi:hypothetical protein